MGGKGAEMTGRELSPVAQWIASWPAWERDAAKALLAKEMTPGAFIDTAALGLAGGTRGALERMKAKAADLG